MFPQQLETWADAEAKCEADGAHLPVPNTLDESKFLGDRTWLGVTDRRARGLFITVTGQRLAFTNWDTAEPRLLSACAQTTRDGRWMTTPCAIPFFFTCEYDGVKADPAFY